MAAVEATAAAAEAMVAVAVVTEVGQEDTRMALQPSVGATECRPASLQSRHYDHVNTPTSSLLTRPRTPLLAGPGHGARVAWPVPRSLSVC